MTQGVSQITSRFHQESRGVCFKLRNYFSSSKRLYLDICEEISCDVADIYY